MATVHTAIEPAGLIQASADEEEAARAAGVPGGWSPSPDTGRWTHPEGQRARALGSRIDVECADVEWLPQTRQARRSKR
jgi:hypothetical protein